MHAVGKHEREDEEQQVLEIVDCGFKPTQPWQLLQPLLSQSWSTSSQP